MAAPLLVLLLMIFLIARFFDKDDQRAAEPTPSPEVQELDERSPLDDDSPAVDSVYYNGRLYTRRDDVRTLLIIGVDDMEITSSLSGRNSSQADMLVLAVVDDTAETITMVQINRDTMSDVPVLDTFGNYTGVTWEQIALAHTYGDGLEQSCENTANAVSRLFYGVPVDHYIALTMGAVPVLNDKVGGVPVTIEDDFTGVDDTLVQGEQVTLSGEQALTYVRARSDMPQETDQTNLARMERQRTYMAALTRRLQSKLSSNEAFLTQLYSAISRYVVSDLDGRDLLEYAAALNLYHYGGVITLEGEAAVGETYMEFTPDEEALQALVIALFYEGSAE